MSPRPGRRHHVDVLQTRLGRIGVRCLTLAGALVALVLATWALGALITDGRFDRGPDHTTLSFMVTQRTAWLDSVMGSVAALGSGLVLVPVAIAFAGLWRWRRGSSLAAWVLAGSYVGASLSFNAVKRLTHRPRPAARFHLAHAGGYAFPSGHGTQAAAMWGAMAFLATRGEGSRPRRIATWAAATAIAGLVGLSRLYLGVHWLSDVLAGWALGSLWLVALIAAASSPSLVGRTDQRLEPSRS